MRVLPPQISETILVCFYSIRIYILKLIVISGASLVASAGKESACNGGDPVSIPGLGRSFGEGIGYPLQYSVLENSMDSIVHGVAELDATE